MTKQRFTPRLSCRASANAVFGFFERTAPVTPATQLLTRQFAKLGCSPDSLRVWCQQAERDAGRRGGLTSAEKDRIS